jgi:hypothetical protein
MRKPAAVSQVGGLVRDESRALAPDARITLTRIETVPKCYNTREKRKSRPWRMPEAAGCFGEARLVTTRSDSCACLCRPSRIPA